MTGVQSHSQTQQKEQSRERRCESGREKRTESLPCAKGKTQPVTEGRSENVKERPTEKNVPEQGCGQFPLRQTPMVVKGLVSLFHLRAPFLCQQHTVVPVPLQSGPWVIEMEVDTLKLLSLVV